jgi:hypothetical protein
LCNSSAEEEEKDVKGKEYEISCIRSQLWWENYILIFVAVQQFFIKLTRHHRIIYSDNIMLLGMCLTLLDCREVTDNNM